VEQTESNKSLKVSTELLHIPLQDILWKFAIFYVIQLAVAVFWLNLFVRASKAEQVNVKA
jgi:energy-converting hydrogenase Eha subunit H